MRVSTMLSLVVLATTQVFGQGGRALTNDTLATVGTSVITARDFLERFELMPWPGKDRRAEHDSAKIKALRSLVAERLLAQEAAARGVGKDSTTQRQITALERLMVRDALYRREVLGRIQVSDRDLSDGMKRYPYQMRTLFLHSPSEDAARSMRDIVRRRGVVDSLLQTLSPELLFRVDTLNVTFGIIDRVLEDTVYALSPGRRLSGVFNSDMFGWGVVALLEKLPFTDAANKSVPDRIRAVETIVRARKQTERAGKFSGSILGPQRAEADAQMFERFAEAFHSVMLTDTVSRATKGGFRFNTADLDLVDHALGDDVWKALVNAGSGALSVRDVIDAFRSREFQFTSLHPELFRNRLNTMIREVVAAELLGREGYRQHLQNSDAVRHDVRIWEEYWTASAMTRALEDTVSVNDAEVVAYFIAHTKVLGRVFEVNVREVLSDSMRTALSVLERALGGTALGDMAEGSVRTEWARRGGVSGFFRVDSLPELGVTALLTDSGSYGGPLHLPEGFSVFQVLGKRHALRDTTANIPPADSLMAYGRRMLRAERRQQVVKNVVSDLAQRSGVRVDVERLRALKVNESNMVTRRYVGFGGVITAVPSIAPMWEWKDPGRPQDVP